MSEYKCIDCGGTVKYDPPETKEKYCSACGHTYYFQNYNVAYYKCQKCKKTYETACPRFDTEYAPIIYLEEK